MVSKQQYNNSHSEVSSDQHIDSLTVVSTADHTLLCLWVLALDWLSVVLSEIRTGFSDKLRRRLFDLPRVLLKMKLLMNSCGLQDVLITDRLSGSLANCGQICLGSSPSVLPSICSVSVFVYSSTCPSIFFFYPVERVHDPVSEVARLLLSLPRPHSSLTAHTGMGIDLCKQGKK